MYQKTLKILDLIKSLTRKSNKIFVVHEIFQRKNKNKGENSENSSAHQIFENKSKKSGPYQISKKKSINAIEKPEN